MKPSLFIIGTARSGTTLLSRMLSAHPDLFIKNEIPGVRRIFNDRASEIEILSAFNQEMIKFYGCNLATFLQREKKKRWGLKDPELTYCFECLAGQFANAKIIFIQRDARAVVNSYMKSKWGLGTNAYTGALRWDREIRMQKSFFYAHRQRSYWIRYEDLLTDTLEEVKKLLGFLGESFHPNVLKYYDQPSYIKKKAQSKNTFKKLDIEIASNWKQQLGASQINIIETVAHDTLLESQYDLVGRQVHISPALKLYFGLHQKILGEFQLQYQLKIAKMINQMKAVRG